MMLLAVLLAATFPTISQLPTGAPALNPSPSVTQFTFVVAGDDRPAKAGDGLTQPLLDTVAALQKNPPALIVWNGDTVYGKSPDGIAAQYTQFLGAFKGLAVPLFNAPGNHEMVHDLDNCKDKGEYPYQDMLTAYTGSMSAPYGVFRYGNAAFVLVNTDDLLDVKIKSKCDYNGYVSKAQLAALTATLAQLDGDTTVAHTFLFMHRPIHDKGSHQIGNGKSDTSAYGKQVEAFRKAIDKGGYKKLQYVFASHDHRYALDTPSGEPAFYITGGAGAPLAGCKKGGSGDDGAYYHYLSVTVNGASVSVQVQPLYGTTPCTQPGS
jgi:Calcineurin-like phosphoesterase